MNRQAIASRAFTISVWATLSIAMAGCGERQPRTYPVQGTVTFADGTPLRTGMVEFRSAQQGLNARGKIDPSGRFELGTFETADGAVEGAHQVIVTQMVAQPDAKPPPRGYSHTSMHGSSVSPQHARYETSGLIAKVDPQPRNDIKLVVQRRGE